VSAVARRVAVSFLGLLWFGFWFFVCFPGLLLVLSGRGLAPASGSLVALGGALVLAGLAAVAVATASFVRRAEGTPVPLDPPRRFVASGLHRFVRNPMYLAYGAILAGEALVFRSPLLGVYVLAFAALAHAYVTRVEEKELLRRFGSDYRRYCDAVPRWCPRRPRRAPPTVAP